MKTLFFQAKVEMTAVATEALEKELSEKIGNAKVIIIPVFLDLNNMTYFPNDEV